MYMEAALIHTVDVWGLIGLSFQQASGECFIWTDIGIMEENELSITCEGSSEWSK